MQQEGELIQIPLAAGNYKPSSGVSFNDCLDGLELLDFLQDGIPRRRDYQQRSPTGQGYSTCRRCAQVHPDQMTHRRGMSCWWAIQ